MADSETKKTVSLGYMIIGLFVFTYFLWYVDGGPERWESKYQKIGKQEIKENIAGTGVFTIDDRK